MSVACSVTVHNGALSQEEIDAYVERATEKYGREPVSMEIVVDGEYVDVTYQFAEVPFHRVRRITGYLVGTLERFNDAKRAEERDRIKHSMKN
ncbi:hypothetical protein LJC74_05480 [Eubacteriales bacterium OttesenSCG-928-A19]|nr:hypothetical protein [Eubacteriales bacterium OttesenSCG-928-A19]